MASRVPKLQASSLAATATKEQKPEKGSISGTQKVATCRTTLLDLSSVKGKRKAMSKISLKKQKKAIEGMEMKEDEEDEGPFSTLKQGSTPAKDQTQSQVQTPSLSSFSTLPNFPA